MQRKGQEGPPVLCLEKRLSLIPQYQAASDAVGAGGREMELVPGDGHVQTQAAWQLRTQLSGTEWETMASH